MEMGGIKGANGYAAETERMRVNNTDNVSKVNEANSAAKREEMRKSEKTEAPMQEKAELKYNAAQNQTQKINEPAAAQAAKDNAVKMIEQNATQAISAQTYNMTASRIANLL